MELVVGIYRRRKDREGVGVKRGEEGGGGKGMFNWIPECGYKKCVM